MKRKDIIKSDDFVFKGDFSLLFLCPVTKLIRQKG